MLYDLNLDDKSFREIEADAVFQIPKECPEWTNYNASDPGIMLVQLLAWLKEVQQYHIDQSSGWKRRKFLQLLGVRIGHIRPALGAVSVRTGLEQDIDCLPLLQGTRFFAGDMPFETIQDEYVQQARLIGAYTMQDGRILGYQDAENEFDKQMRLYPFGEQPQTGNQCCFVLDRALEPAVSFTLSFVVCTSYGITRNPIRMSSIKTDDPASRVHAGNTVYGSDASGVGSRYDAGNVVHGSGTPGSGSRYDTGNAVHGSGASEPGSRYDTGNAVHGSGAPGSGSRYDTGNVVHGSDASGVGSRYDTGNAVHGSDVPGSGSRYDARNVVHGSDGTQAEDHFDTGNLFDAGNAVHGCEGAGAEDPLYADFVPLAKLRWEYWSADGWNSLMVEADHTYALVQSGTIRFRMQQEMAEHIQMGAYLLRVTLEENDYDVSPLVYNIYLNEIPLKQQYTMFDYEDTVVQAAGQEEISITSSLYLASAGAFSVYLQYRGGFRPMEGAVRRQTDSGVEIRFPKPQWAEEGPLICRLAVWEEQVQDKQRAGIGNAFADQVCLLHIPSILYDAFEIMVYDPVEDVFVPYTKVDDFDNCTPEDTVYVLDVEENRLLFGDCERGLAPSGDIRILRLKTSLGMDGNVKAGKISQCEAYPRLLVRQYQTAAGGCDNETLEECFARVRRQLKSMQRGVTYADYEQLVREAPGLLIIDSRVIPPAELAAGGTEPEENQISIVVQPLSYQKHNAKLSKAYRKNLLRLLNRRKLLGTQIQLLHPEYIGILIYAEIVIKPHFSDAEARIAQVVQEYLDERSWKIGAPVQCSTLYGIIDTLSCVWLVQSLSADAVGKGCRRLAGGDIALPPNGLAYLEEFDLHIYTSEE